MLRLDRLDAVLFGVDAVLTQAGPRPSPGAVALLERLRAAGVATAVVSVSRHCGDMLAAAGLDGLFDARVHARPGRRCDEPARHAGPRPPTPKPPPGSAPIRRAQPSSRTRPPGWPPGGEPASGW